MDVVLFNIKTHGSIIKSYGSSLTLILNIYWFFLWITNKKQGELTVLIIRVSAVVFP